MAGRIWRTVAGIVEQVGTSIALRLTEVEQNYQAEAVGLPRNRPI